MNRRRNETRTPAWVFCSLFLAFGIVAVGGVLHTVYKNRQIQLTREIQAIEGRIDQYGLDIRTTEMRMDQLLNRFVIRTQIEASGSSLKPIPSGVTEDVDTAKFTRHSVAAVDR